MSGAIGRTTTIARHEFRTAWRRVSTWVLMVLLLLLSWGFVSGGVIISTGSAAVGGDRPHLNSMFNIGFVQIIYFSFFYVFFLAVSFGTSLIEDDGARVGPLLHSSSLSPREYVFGRFLGQALTYAVIIAAQTSLLAAFMELYPIDEPEKVRGALSLLNYAWPTLLFVAVPAIFFGGLSFAIGGLTRQTVLVFILPVATLLGCAFFLWSWSPEWLDESVNRALMLVDPTGFRWLRETYLSVDRGAAFYNSTPIALDGLMIANRILCVAIGLGSVAWVASREARRVRATHRIRAANVQVAIEDADAADKARIRAPVASVGKAMPAMAQGRAGVAGSFMAALRTEARELRRAPGLFIFVPLIILQVVGEALSVPGAFDTPRLLTPGGMAAGTFNTVVLLSLLLLLFYATESIGRDERCRMSPIVRSSGASMAATLAGRVLANCVVVLFAILGGTYLAAVLTLAIQGLRNGIWIAPSPMPFLGIWSALLLPTILVWLAFVTLAWALTRNRFAVYGLGLGVLILTGWLVTRGWVNWVFNWHLWNGALWTDFGAFELDRSALVLNRCLWISVAIGVFAVALRLLPERTADPQGVASRLRPWPVARAILTVIPFGVVPLVLAIWLGLDVRAGEGGGPMRRATKDYWRKNVNTWREAKQPFVDALVLDLTLDPAAGTFAVEGEYTLRNPDDEPLARFALTPGPAFEDLQWTFEGAVRGEADPSAKKRESPVHDSGGLWVFTPAKPLAKDETITVGFRHHGRHPAGIGFTTRGAGEFILPAGVVLNSFSPSFLPLVGFVDGIGLESENQPETRVPTRDEWKKKTRPAFGYGSQTMVKATVRLPSEYRANCPGVLVSDEVAGAQRTMVWQTDAPIRFFNVVAGRWSEHEGPTTSIWHLAAHQRNVPAMSEALEAARTFYSKWFHPYPWKELRLSEFPGLAGYAQGFGTNIVFSESIGFLALATEDEDAPFLITAHEAAHQWWGNILMPGDGPGGNILSEGMAHFSTARLFEEKRGERARQSFLRKIEDSYGTSRRPDDERPLVEIDGSRPGDGAVTYDKGGWVFWMMMDMMGRERFDEGLRDFITTFKDGPDYPLLQDFVESMRRHATDLDAYDAFTQQWFFTVVAPEFSLDEAKATKSGEEWTTTCLLANKGTGRATVEVAVVTAGKRWAGQSDVPYEDARTTVTIGPGESAEVEIGSRFEPKSVLVDPDVRVLQINRRLAKAEINVTGG